MRTQMHAPDKIFVDPHPAPQTASCRASNMGSDQETSPSRPCLCLCSPRNEFRRAHVAEFSKQNRRIECFLRSSPCFRCIVEVSSYPNGKILGFRLCSSVRFRRAEFMAIRERSEISVNPLTERIGGRVAARLACELLRSSAPLNPVDFIS